jgi:hypothetical protein
MAYRPYYALLSSSIQDEIPYTFHIAVSPFIAYYVFVIYFAIRRNREFWSISTQPEVLNHSDAAKKEGSKWRWR